MQDDSNTIFTKPWGSFQTLAAKDGCQVKLITVNPGQKLSLQKHEKRFEHWIVVAGRPTITVNNSVRSFEVNNEISIPCGAIHRIENFTDETVRIIEVQVGDYFGEDDIVRLEDIYGRVPFSKEVK